MKFIEPVIGTTQKRAAFLWWPKKIGRVDRWLEMAEWGRSCVKLPLKAKRFGATPAGSTLTRKGGMWFETKRS